MENLQCARHCLGLRSNNSDQLSTFSGLEEAMSVDIVCACSLGPLRRWRGEQQNTLLGRVTALGAEAPSGMQDFHGSLISVLAATLLT